MHPCTNTSKPITVTDAMVYIYAKRGCHPDRLRLIEDFFRRNSKKWCFGSEEIAFKNEVYHKETDRDFKEFLDTLLQADLVVLVSLDRVPVFKVTQEQYWLLNELRRTYQNDNSGLYRHCKLALFLAQNYQTEIFTYDRRAEPIIVRLGLRISNHLKHEFSQITGYP